MKHVFEYDDAYTYSATSKQHLKFPRYLLETLENQLRKYKIGNRWCLLDFAILEPKNFFRNLFVVVSDEKILC